MKNTTAHNIKSWKNCIYFNSVKEWILTRRHKLWVFSAVITTIILISALLILGMGGHNNQANIKFIAPQPAHFTDDISAAFLSSDNIPDLNDNRNLSGIDSLLIYSDSYDDIFIPNLNDNDIGQNIKITPVIKGNWHRYSNEILFTPDQGWPADTKFTFKIAHKIFNPDIRPSTRSVTFRTPDISAELDSFNIYPAPAQPKSVVGVAVISFNYPINTKDFSDKVLLKLDGHKLNCSIKFDRFHRTAMVISEPVAITDKPQIMRLKLNKIPARDSNAQTQKLTAHTTIESSDNFFKITDITTTVADNDEGNAQQLIILNTSAAIQPKTKWPEYIHAYLLPEHIPSDNDDDEPHDWALDEVTPDILHNAKQINLKPIEFASPYGIYQYTFAYEVSASAPRYIYVTTAPGLKSSGGFELRSRIEKVMPVPYPTPTVKIAGSGALLSMAGDKQLGIMARGGLSQAYVSLFKIKSSEINHLVTQTYNLFTNNLDFMSYSFGKYDMASVFQKTIPFANTSVTRTNYASIDLGEYLDRTGADKTGIFIIQTGATKEDAEFSDQRLIMLTNMGIINKKNLDGSSVLFVSNLANGTPASDTEISVLGRNGNPIWVGRTDEDGHAEIPRFSPDEYRNARAPVAIVAKQENDVTFIPYDADGTLATEYSKFDIDGEYTYNTTPLNAFVFSDRGIYRPGENAIIAGIIKNKSFKSLAGIPVKLEILDARGRTVLTNSISLESDGMFDVKYDIPSNAALGTYTVRINSLNAKNKAQDMIGYTTFQIAEFTPDTMKINATINDTTDMGWISDQNITATISLQNMFGAPATEKRISATATLTPISFTFPQYREYIFTPNFISNSGLAQNATTRNQTYTVTLPDILTDDSGIATLNVEFDTPISLGTYILTLNVRGTDTNTGKSVQTAITNRVSDAKYLVGYHSNSDLSYINRNSDIDVNLVAINNTATATDASDLTMRLIKRENLTSLVKDTNNYYKYQTVSRDKTIFSKKINIPESGTKIKLDTTDGGTYFMQILDSSDNLLSNIEYYVVSSENKSLSVDTTAEMKIKLDKNSYKPGDKIEININAPYIGAGLITIERDRVYAYKWFQTQTASSVQTITVPADFEGTGYINVAFVRNINSRDIFTNPYSYAVAPFSADISAHKIDVTLTAPEKIDSNQLTIEYQTNRNARLMIFAVNTGILQVAHYQLPKPLAHFFKKSALQVETFQTLSLLLPEYKILREFAKTGGGDYADLGGNINQMLTNPFARKLSKPVAFYSGIISAQANTPNTITFEIPEEFNGSITTFAIATEDTAIGAANTETHIQAPIIVTSNTPTFASPDDKMEINANILNLTTDSDADASVTIYTTTTDNLILNSPNTTTLQIPSNANISLTYDISATGKLGNGELTINASLFDNNAKHIATRRSVSTLSIRPITTYKTVLKSGAIASASETVRDFQIDMYPEMSDTQIFISQNATPALRPMFEYLAHYDFACTEQTVSRTIPYVLMSKNAFLGTNYEDSAKQINNTINILKNRQNDDGSFDLWSGGKTTSTDTAYNCETAYLTAYVVQFLIMAKKHGFNIPKDMLARGTDYLRTYVGGTITNDADAAAVAYAIYVITSNGYITTSYINIFEEYANTHIKNWQETIMGAYIASAYKLLKQSDKATDLIAKYKMSKSGKFVYQSMFSNNVANDAIYAYLLTQYFNTTPSEISAPIQEYLNSGNYSAFTSATVIMGLAGLQSDNTNLTKQVSIFCDDTKLSGEIISDTYVATIPANTHKITIKCEKCDRDNKLRYTTQQRGFPQSVTHSNNGLEIVREYYNASGDRVTSGNIGDIITVKIFARTRGVDTVPNVAITDLLPGGFIPDSESLTGTPDFAEVREDRVLIYTNLTRQTQEFTYTAQLGTGGAFTIPPIYAESMYNPQVNATGNTGTFTVTNATPSE